MFRNILACSVGASMVIGGGPFVYRHISAPYSYHIAKDGVFWYTNLIVAKLMVEIRVRDVIKSTSSSTFCL